MAQEGSEAGDYYNNAAIEFIKGKESLLEI